MSIKESVEYENFLDQSTIENDEYTNSLERFVGYVDTSTRKVSEPVKKGSDEKYLYIRFENLEKFTEFCEAIGQAIPHNKTTVYYPQHDPETSLFDDDGDSTPIKIKDPSMLVPRKAKQKRQNPRDRSWKAHWKNMPDYVQEDQQVFRCIKVMFRTDDAYDRFIGKFFPAFPPSNKSVWYPEKPKANRKNTRWIEDEPYTEPQYPLYIVSKGRYDSMYTSRNLAKMNVKHYIVIEPQEEQQYQEALEKFDIGSYATLLIAPFSNHGDGPGRARNWAWDHSMSIGATHHWVLDDNIMGFYRLHDDDRYRMRTGVFFRAMEDFVDRYDNVYLAGPQYRFFAIPGQYRPPFVLNTRIYSVLLIRNSCQHRWRGRYNEDTDLSLRILKDGDCTVEFNAFLQDKAATQTVKGGNTEEFYHKEGETNREDWDRSGNYNATGTINKSKMLVDMHPDVATMVWKYDRWHHHVNYTPFKKNKLKFKEGISIPDVVNNYNNLRLVSDDD